jgi:hypothetical protein
MFFKLPVNVSWLFGNLLCGMVSNSNVCLLVNHIHIYECIYILKKVTEKKVAIFINSFYIERVKQYV